MMTLKIIIGKINGLYPVPGAFFIYKGERYKILKAEIGSGSGKPGEVSFRLFRGYPVVIKKQ